MKTANPDNVTLHQVAARAGVSPATVSRFLNGTARVSVHKRTCIEDAIAALSYKPNRLAQNLKLGSTRTIGVLTQSLTSGYFTDATTGIEDTVARSGYALLIVSGHWHAGDEAERVEMLIGRRVDGVVILSGSLSDDQIAAYAQRVPIVAFGRQLAADRLAGFCLDNYSPACAAMELLIQQGHRRIAFIRGPDAHEDARRRLAGYRDTLERHQIPVEAGLIAAGDFSESGGLMATNQLLASGLPFSAIFACNDQSAYGARLALYRRGIRVPEDVSLVGYDDLNSSMYTTPPLTTVRQPLYEVGNCIGQMMMELIAGRPVTVAVPALSLVVRESVRRIA